MIRKAIAAVLTFYWEFMKKHTLLSFFTSLIMLAGCVGAIYLLAKQLPTIMSMPCFSDGCAN